MSMQKGWALWSKIDGGHFIEAFISKSLAKARIDRLLLNAPWRKRTDYELRQVTLPKHRFFELRK
jgi:hypothetical protein